MEIFWVVIGIFLYVRNANHEEIIKKDRFEMFYEMNVRIFIWPVFLALGSLNDK